MRIFAGVDEVNEYLAGLMPETRSRRHAYTLDTMQRLMGALDNPQNSYRVIHVAGTSGKSSTCYYLSAMLEAAGQKVGLSVSPHVYEVGERVQIHTQPLPEKTFCEEFSLFLAEVEATGIKPTYFEILVAFAYWEFARQKVDYAVIEVGLGGLLDGTNVISRADKVCVITDIGLDHTDTLGKTLPAIAAQKAGIILPNNVVFTYDQTDEVMQVLREVAEQKQAELHEVWPLASADLPRNLPLFQRRNWYLALSACRYIAQRDGVGELDEAMLAATTQTYVPARMETVVYKGKTIVLDGAHNPQKLSSLVRSIKHAYPKQPIACMVSFVKSKQAKIHANLAILLPIVTSVVVTDLSIMNADHAAANPLDIVKHCEELDFHAWELAPDPVEAFGLLMNRKEEVVLVVGSFFLPETVRPLMIET